MTCTLDLWNVLYFRRGTLNSDAAWTYHQYTCSYSAYCQDVTKNLLKLHLFAIKDALIFILFTLAHRTKDIECIL